MTFSPQFYLVFVFELCLLLPSGVNFINVYTYEFFVWTSFWQLFLETFWLWMNFCTKNARVKCWWNWRQTSLILTDWKPVKSTFTLSDHNIFLIILACSYENKIAIIIKNIKKLNKKLWKQSLFNLTAISDCDHVIGSPF